MKQKERQSFLQSAVIMFSTPIILIMIGVLSVLLLICTGIWYRSYSAHMFEYSEKQMKLVGQALTAEFYNDSEIANSLSTYEDIRPFYLQHFPSKGNKLVRSLNTHFTNNNILDEIYFHFFVDEYYFSTQTSFSTRSFLQLFQIYNDPKGAELCNRIQTITEPFFITDLSLRQSASKSTQDKLLLYIYPYYVDNSIQGVLIFQINVNNLNAFIGNESSTNTFLFDSTGMILNYESNELTKAVNLHYAKGEIQSMLKTLSKGECKKISSKNQNLILGNIPNCGLYFIHVEKEPSIIGILMPSFLIYFVLLVISICYITVVDRKKKSLCEELKSLSCCTDDNVEENFHKLFVEYNEILKENSIYQEKENSNKRKNFFMELLWPSESTESELRERSKECGIELDANWNFIVICKYEEIDDTTLTDTFANRDRFPYHIQIPNDNEYAVWIIGSMYYISFDELQSNYSTQNMTVGNMYAELSGLHRSYAEAQSFWNISSDPHAYYSRLDDQMKADFTGFLEDAENNIKECKIEDFIDNIKSIQKKCEEQKIPSIVQSYIWGNLVKMSYSCPLLSGNNYQKTEVETLVLDNRPNTLFELLKKQVDKLIDVRNQLNKPKAPPLSIEAVIEEIENNYCDPNFSLQLLADHFDISLSYLSLFFKEKQGDNLLNYYTMLRMSKAKELFQTTDLSTKEVIEKVGYANVSSFIRRFKQIYGITPGNYKKAQPQNENNSEKDTISRK